VVAVAHPRGLKPTAWGRPPALAARVTDWVVLHRLVLAAAAQRPGPFGDDEEEGPAAAASVGAGAAAAAAAAVVLFKAVAAEAGWGCGVAFIGAGGLIQDLGGDACKASRAQHGQTIIPGHSPSAL